MIEKVRPGFLRLSTILYNLSVSRNLVSKAEMSKFGSSGTEGLIYVQLCIKTGYKICIGTCKTGYSMFPFQAARCVKRKSWQNPLR